MKYNFDKIINRYGTASVKYDALKHFYGTDDLLPLWVADMDFETPDFIINAINERLKHKILGYGIRDDNFNKSFINWAKKRYNWTIKDSFLSFAPGVVAAISISVQAFTSPGDKIIIQTPVYPPFFRVVKGNVRNLILNPLINDNGYYKIDFEKLVSQIDEKTKMIILSNPHNPVGRVWNTEELKQLTYIAEKYDLIIVSDDIHADIIYKPIKYIPLGSISEVAASRTISIFSPSKTFNIAGLSTSIVVIPNPNLLKKYNELLTAQHLFLGNIIGNVAFPAAYKHGEKWLEQLLDYLTQNRDFVFNYIKNKIPKIKLSKPEGSFLLWLDFNNFELTHNEIFNILIKKAKIALNNGSDFGENGEKFFRMNIGAPKKIIEQAMHNIYSAFANI